MAARGPVDGNVRGSAAQSIVTPCKNRPWRSADSCVVGCSEDGGFRVVHAQIRKSTLQIFSAMSDSMFGRVLLSVARQSLLAGLSPTRLLTLVHRGDPARRLGRASRCDGVLSGGCAPGDGRVLLGKS